MRLEPAVSHPRVDRWARAVAIAACAFFGLATGWEIGGPLQGGHWGAMAGCAIAGENMLRYRTFAVLLDYLSAPPLPAEYYMHHPYGSFVDEAVVHAFFPHGPVTARLPALIFSALSAPLVYKLARAIWSDRLVGAIAVLTFVFVPVDLAFSTFVNLEVPTIFFCLLFSWATVRLWQSWQKRYLVLAAIGAIGAANGDWIGILFVGLVAGFGFLRAYLLPRAWFGARIHERYYANWFAFAVAASAGTLVLYIVLFAKADHLADLLMSYHQRSTGSEAPFATIFGQRRKMWFSWMVTPIGAGAVAAGLPLSLVRLPRRPAEFLPIAWTMMATVQYLVFKQGADVHIFWPHYYGVCAALGMGVVAATLLGVRRWVLAKLGARGTVLFGLPSAAVIALIFSLPIALLARMALPQLRQARITSGRFDDGGRFIEPEADASQFTTWAVADLPATAIVARTPSLAYGYHIEYSAHRIIEAAGADPGIRGSQDPDRIALLDVRRTAAASLRADAGKYGIEAVGPYWRIDRAGPGSFRAVRYVERQPSWLQWYFVSGTDLIRTIGPDEDPWATWEWQDALGIDATLPSYAPGTFEELRVAHNVAVSRGERPRADALRSRLEGAITDSRHTDFSGDVHLIGARVEYGPATVATLLWETGPGYKPVEAAFEVKCNVVAAPHLWPSGTDYFEKDMAPPMTMGPALWKPSYIYVQRFVVRHRIGTESCVGSFSSPELHPLMGGGTVPLFTFR